MTEKELQLLRTAAENFNGRIQGFDGYTAALLLRVAVATALRESRELLQLTWDCFDSARAIMRTRTTKNGRTAKQPLPQTLVDDLQRYGEDKKPTDAIFVPARRPRDEGKPHHFRGGDFMRQLCELAGVDYETSEGVADFYSLRHTGITRYILGHTLTETVIFARHSDPKLTILRYGHLEDNEVERRLRGLSLKKYGLDIRPADAGDDDSNEPGSDAPACVKQAGASDVAAMNICVENLDCEMDWNRTDLDGFLESNIDELVSGDNASASEEKPLFSRGFIEKTRVENMVCPTGIEPATCAL